MKNIIKGQLNSNDFLVSSFGPKNQRNFLRISALAPKNELIFYLHIVYFFEYESAFIF